jgi:acetyltransferase-like isoleucine patch superfamily enzyme
VSAKSRGVLVFAFNTERIDYVEIAVRCARLAKHTLNLPVTLITEPGIENNVFVGPNATFTNDKIPKAKSRPEAFDQIVIKKHASIGANATIVAPIEIGEYSLIGAGSVLTKSTLPFTLWFGNPAKQMGYITKSGVILNMKMKDKFGNEYIFLNSELVKR